jgi:hypothetical protein
MSDNGGPGFGPMPPVSSGEIRRAKPPVPWEVNLSFGMWLISAVISLVEGIVSVVNKDQVIADLIAVAGNSGLPPEEVRRAATLGFYFGLGFILIFVLLFTLFVFKMRAGRNWARVVLAVLAVVNLMSEAAVSGTSDLFTMGTVLIVVVGLVFMFTPNSNAYFAAFRRSR